MFAKLNSLSCKTALKTHKFKQIIKCCYILLNIQITFACYLILYHFTSKCGQLIHLTEKIKLPTDNSFFI